MIGVSHKKRERQKVKARRKEIWEMIRLIGSLLSKQSPLNIKSSLQVRRTTNAPKFENGNCLKLTKPGEREREVDMIKQSSSKNTIQKRTYIRLSTIGF